MTTKPESTDPGESDELLPRLTPVAWNESSAGDQAVGYITAEDLATLRDKRGIEYMAYLPDDEYCIPLYTRAQDAAGVVSMEQIVAIVREIESIAGVDLGLANDEYCTIHEAALGAAKPAQVGQKYRAWTLMDVSELYAAIGKAGGHSFATMFKVLNARGAVVPAQDGGV